MHRTELDGADTLFCLINRNILYNCKIVLPIGEAIRELGK